MHTLVAEPVQCRIIDGRDFSAIARSGARRLGARRAHPAPEYFASAADDPHRRQQDARDSGLDVAAFDHCDISAEVGMFNKKLKFNFFRRATGVGAVAALEGPKDVTEHMVRFVCDMLETCVFGVCVRKCEKTSQLRCLCRALLSQQDNSRRF